MVYFGLQLNSVQNFIATRIKNKLEPFLGVEIQFNNISIDMLNRIVVNDLTILDTRKDTIVEADKLTFGFHNINFAKKRIKIHKIELEQANIHFTIDSARNLNLQYIVEKALGSDTSNTPGWRVEFDNIGLVDCRLRIEDYIKSPYSGKGVNFSDMVLDHLNIRVRDLTAWDGLATMKINRLSFIENSGFTVEQLSGRLSVKKTMLHFNNLILKTPKSSFEAPRLYFDFDRFGNFAEFDTKVDISFWFRESEVSLSDISYFTEDIYGMKQRLKFQGHFKGKFSSMNCTEVAIKTGAETTFSGGLYLVGLPDFRNVHINMKADKLIVSPMDVEEIYFPQLADQHIILPEIVKKIGNITFKGTFKGTPTDFVTLGNFSTSAGVLNTDVTLKTLSNDNIAISGNVSARKLAIGKLIKKEDILGSGNFDLQANVTIKEGSKISGIFNAMLNNCEFNKYTYSSISVNGALNENAFDGIVKIEDPNVKISSAGYFNFSKANRTFNFSTTVYQANPLALNFTKDSINYISGQLIANMKGHHLDSIEGEIGVSNVLFKKNKQSLAIKNIFITSDNRAINKKITIQSDILQANIRGSHEVSALPASIINFARYYLPETFQKYAKPLDSDLNDFAFDVVFKNTGPVLNFFAPGSVIAEGTSFKGNYNPSAKALNYSIESDSIKWGALRFQGFKAKGASNPDSLWMDLTSSQLLVSDQISLLNTKASLSAHSDSIFINSNWHDSVGHKSNLVFLSHMINTGFVKPVLLLDVYPSEIYILKELWTVNKVSLIKDSSSIFIPNLVMFNDKHKINISGSISEDPNDILEAEFSNFDLNIVNFLLNSPKLKLDGNLSGKLSVSDYYHSRQVYSNINIDEFVVNKEYLGKTGIGIRMNNFTQKMNVKASSKTPDGRFLKLDGDYTPEGSKLDFNFSLEGIGAHIFQPFIESVFDIEKGKMSGTGTLSGNTTYPLLNTQLQIDSASAQIKALKTSYSFNTPLRILDNKVLLKNIKLVDADNNICKLDGYIDNQYFNSFQLYLNLLLENNLVLDLKSTDEMPIYGKGYASGIVRITGNPDQVNIDIIGAKTEKNSVIYIPLNEENIVANDFIEFVNKQKKDEKKKKQQPTYQIKSSGLVLNIDLEVSPEAEVQLVFDPALGDIMRAQGSGNLKLELNKSGDFTVRGNYIVKSGDYLFTLKNLLNKQFVINQGGTITFNGSPLDATLDLTALYKTRTSLYNLFYEDESKKRVPVNCQLFITGKLLNPDIRYDIMLPNAADETRNRVKEAINNEQELSKQFMSLLVLNNFLPDPYKATTAGAQQTNASIIGRDAAASTSLDLLSSQVSNWMSQISKDFDVGVNYRPGDKNYTNQEFEVAMSTQLLDDRVSINGNLDFIGNQATTNTTKQNTSSLVGDVNVEVKVTDKFLLKAFNRSNDQLVDYNDLYTRGFGVIYREEFRNLSELRQRYYQMLFASKPKTVATTDTTAKKQ